MIQTMPQSMPYQSVVHPPPVSHLISCDCGMSQSKGPSSEPDVTPLPPSQSQPFTVVTPPPPSQSQPYNPDNNTDEIPCDCGKTTFSQKSPSPSFKPSLSPSRSGSIKQQPTNVNRRSSHSPSSQIRRKSSVMKRGMSAPPLFSTIDEDDSEGPASAVADIENLHLSPQPSALSSTPSLSFGSISIAEVNIANSRRNSKEVTTSVINPRYSSASVISNINLESFTTPQSLQKTLVPSSSSDSLNSQSSISTTTSTIPSPVLKSHQQQQYKERIEICDACPNCLDVCSNISCTTCLEKITKLKCKREKHIRKPPSSYAARKEYNTYGNYGTLHRLNKELSREEVLTVIERSMLTVKYGSVYDTSGDITPPRSTGVFALSGISSRQSDVKLYTPCQVRRHASVSSCWITSSNKIYDCTSYLYIHPGGLKSILRHGGGKGDCSDDFNFHSKRGRRVWKGMFVGELCKCPGGFNDGFSSSAGDGSIGVGRYDRSAGSDESVDLVTKEHENEDDMKSGDVNESIGGFASASDTGEEARKGGCSVM